MSKAQPLPVSSVPNLSGASQFIYDEAGQLVKEIADSPFYKYAYDSKGNILTAKEYAVSVNDNGEKVYTLKSDGNNTFVYGNTWQDMLTSFNGESITYDAIGNPLSYKGNTLTWTMGRQLTTYGTNTYTYNEDGIRTSKTVDGVTTQYYLNGTDIIQQSDGTNTLYFYYDNASEVVGFNYNNNDYFYVKNMMDDIVAIVDSTGTVVAEYTYSPWGEVTSVTGSNVTLGELNPFRYRSYYYDSDIEMYYLQSRYYDPEICRFINCDDVRYIGITTSELSYNPFAYCVNNPTNKVDSTGTLSTFVIVCIIGGALIGGGIGGYVAWKNCKLKKNKGLWVLGGILMGAVAGAAIGAVVGMVGKTVIAKLAAIGPKVTTKTGFASFSKLKSAIGRAGDGRAWHHIVEQTTSNVNKFGAKMIHNTKNIVNVPHGKGTLHAKLSGYYSSKQPFTNGLTVRKWLSTQSYAKQYEFGMKKLLEFAEELGVKIYFN